MLTSRILENDALAHGFFTREGGISEGLYRGLNCGPGSNDAPARVTENRSRAMAMIGQSAEALRTVYQIHSTEVLVLDNDQELTPRPKADAMVTKVPGLALGILTADCVPVLFADMENGVIGAAHSGWKGALGNISACVVEEMTNLGASKQNIRAAIGPAIAQVSYEVGPEFPAPFLKQDPAAEKFFIPSENPERHMFDLTGFVRAALEKLEIGGIDHLDNDTCTEEDQFFSYRRMVKRGEADYGRQLSAIVLNG
ncbi:peptidoglycan editing factor PgeF [Sneathiella sp.]|uniref:peptidoglycan editing factor PgeF n=1 Tax=Sneathiella sp. TaxID=1964365 RepID=UPI00261127FC|nr:peptidoglycan editing factor PgeF [Sneathiella sp.]MDF2367796.1 peptidoglycan editing factor PgeF [Sneathiella sp.]